MVDDDFQQGVNEWLDGLKDVFLTMKDDPEGMAAVAAAMVGLSIMIYPDLRETLGNFLQEVSESAA